MQFLANINFFRFDIKQIIPECKECKDIPECKECKDIVNWKGRLVKHHYSSMQLVFVGICVGNSKGNFVKIVESTSQRSMPNIVVHQILRLLYYILEDGY